MDELELDEFPDGADEDGARITPPIHTPDAPGGLKVTLNGYPWPGSYSVGDVPGYRASGDMPWQYTAPSLPPDPRWFRTTPAVIASPLTAEQVRIIVEEAVHKALHPVIEGKEDRQHSAHVTIVADDGTLWRGTVYPVDKMEEAR